MKINFSLSLKLTLIILSTSVCIIVASTYITVNEQTRFFENAYSEKATALAQALDASIGSRNELEDKEKIHDYILKFIYTNKEDVLRISINLPENDELKVAVSSDSESEGFLSSQDNYISYEKDISISIPSHTDNSHTLTVITPLHISGQTIGTYEMLLSMDKAYASLNTHLTNIITTSIILLFILIITSTYLLRKIIVKPVTIFMDAANKIGEGKLDTKINIKSHDELGKLAKSFNKMAKDLKKSKAETEKYDKMLEEMLDQREEFINQLGHDLKNPLTPIVGLLPIISGEIKDPDIKKHLQVVMANVEYMRNLITKTLQLARLRSTDIKFDIENMNLNEEINNILKTKNMLLREKEIEVKNKVDEKIMVKADKLRFRELFENLVSNAIKYTPKGGEAVTIDAKKEKRHIEVSVKDTGIGINKRQIKRVFDEFYKADKSRHELESSGLGLSICKRIVEKHGGHIWVESKGLGKGSTFYFTLETGEIKKEKMN